MKINRFLISFVLLSILGFGLVGELPAQNANRGLRIPRTIFNDPFVDQIIQPGGAAFLPDDVPPDQAYTVGFWLRRDFDNEEIRALTDDPLRHIVAGYTFRLEDESIQGVFRGAFPPGTTYTVPNDERWHYLVARFGGSGGVSWWVDGVPVFNAGGWFDQFSLGASAWYFGDGELRNKNATFWNIVLDDIVVWRSNSDEVLELTQEIVRYGQQAFDPTNPDVLYYYDCNSVGSAPEYFEDVAFFQDNNNLAANGYTVRRADPPLIDVQEKPRPFVIVTVNSGYGAERVTPKVSESGDFAFQTNLQTPTEFSAPKFVYLDRYGNELDPTPENIQDKAFYRAVNTGYTVQGGEVDIPGENSFSELLQSDITVTWTWELEVAVLVESATEEYIGLSDSDGNPLLTGAPVEQQSGLNKVFLPKGTSVRASIDKRIIPGSDISLGGLDVADRRFANRGLVVDNAANTGGDRSLVFDGVDDLVNGSITPPNLTDFTLEFWIQPEGSVDADHPVFFMNRPGNNFDFLTVFLTPSGDGYSMAIASNDFPQQTVDEVFLADGNWHHWAWVYRADTEELSVYRDNRLIETFAVGTFDYPAFPSTLWLGTYLTTPGFEGGLNNFRLWSKALTRPEIETARKSATATPEAALVLDVPFDTPSLTTTPPETGTWEGNMANFDNQWPADAKEAEQLVGLFPSFEFTGELPEGNRIDSGEITLDDWLRVTWYWEGQFRLTVDATSDGGDGGTVDLLPYVTTDGPTQDLTESGSIWVPELESVTVGTLFRTPERFYTLGAGNQISSVLNQTGVFADIVDESLLDGTREGVASRELTIPRVMGPGTITFNYTRTIFRAFVPIGESLDAANPNFQLVPDLPGVSPVLTTTVETPYTSATPGIEFDTGFVGSQSLYWDAAERRVLPVNPGIFQILWPDAQNGAISYNIEIITGLPTELESGFYFELETEDGYRQTDGEDNFVRSFQFGDVSDAYPASPESHYRVAYNSKTPGVELDPNEADRWFFLEHTFSERGSAAFDDAQRILTMEGAGRSVLLYSYTPNPNETATGNRSTEALAVRVVESALLPAIDDLAISGSNRKEFAPAPGSEDHYLVLPFLQDQNSAYSPGPGTTRTVDFWFSLNEVAEDYAIDRILAELYVNTTEAISVGVRGPGHPTAPNQVFAELSYQKNDSVESAVVINWGQMHHLAVVYDGIGNKLQVFLDGQLVIDEERPKLIPPGSINMGIGTGYLRFLRTGQSASLFGRVDNLRYWNRGLTPSEIRQFRTDYTTALAPIIHRFDEPTLNPFPNTGSGGGGFILFHLAGAPSVDPSVAFFDQQYDSFPEVATRLRSRLDTARLGSGFSLNEVSNYNANIYNRENGVGQWGPLFPVNWAGLFTGINQLSVLYYENPFRQVPARNVVGTTEVLHPNVNWPYVAVNYDNVTFPENGPNADNRIYIASRLGTEGVDVNANEQFVFDPATTSALTVYNQPDPSVAGLNPNEEHAVIAPSIKAVLTGDSTFALGQDAVFALQNGLNIWGETDSNASTTDNQASEFTSEPWVLVQYLDANAMPQMKAYQVEQTRTVDGNGADLPSANLFPALDPDTDEPTDVNGQPVPQPAEPLYDFIYPAFAGDLLTAPYPLNVVIGPLLMEDSWGGNLLQQRSLWKANNGFHWVVSGDRQFFYKNWYPLRADFWFDRDRSGANDVAPGTPIAWVPDGTTFLEDGDPETNEMTEGTQPTTILYNTYWKSDYPVLKRGETLTYPGGEFKAENPSAQGLPGVVGWASAEIVFDTLNRPMVVSDVTIDNWGARIVRPLDRIEVDWNQSDFPTSPVNLTPANSEKILVEGSRWYFKDLAGSLQKRFYFDSISQKLVFRGRLNDLEGGDPSLTATPTSLYVLEPNAMTRREYEDLLALTGGGEQAWIDAIVALYEGSQDPHGTGLPTETGVAPAKYYSGVEPIENAFVSQPIFFNSNGRIIGSEFDIGTPALTYLNSLGAGAALVPNPELLVRPADNDLYVTLAENNHPEAGGAVTVHVVRIGAERFRGAIKLVEAQDVFDEKVNLQHTGDFGANTENNYYEWWVREVAPLGEVGLPGNDPEWLPYQTGRGLHSITFEGDPATALSDKLFFVRYGPVTEFTDITGESNILAPGLESVSPSSWRLVDLNNPLDTWDRYGAARPGDETGDPVPFQWAGAANSPQLQADGSLRYIPQLIPGWVKRVLDRINPYEARYADFYNEESPSVFSSQLQLAGGPYVGNVALNSSKDAIENVGLIELYRTILDRAKNLSIDNSTNPLGGFGIQQALLLATTRLATLYELLAQEAYSDAQDPTITVPEGDGLSDVAPFIHAFYNQEASLLHEELALLRGTDYRKSYPSFNRLFWNYVKGLGEAAYNKNYNIQDINEDGIINEFDAAEMYPQGHGDAYGHSLSALKMSYELLRNNLFNWEARPELYSLMDNVLEADYLDELRFSKIAAERARTSAQIVEATYSLEYTENPEAQWQGYTDPDPARAWGVSEWARRGGHGAYFDWVTGNAMLPTDADDLADDGSVPENLEQLDRNATRLQLGEIASAKLAIQTQLDQANRGGNPLGFDADTIAFDIQPVRYDQSAETPFQEGHFLQTYNKAVSAAENALAALSLATQENRKIQHVSNDTRALQVKAIAQDVTYRNELIQIFGQPYAGLIGPGQIYEEGYIGPDLLLYNYIDRNDLSDLEFAPPSLWTNGTESLKRHANDFSGTINWDHWNFPFFGVKVRESVQDMFEEYYVTADPNPASVTINLPVQQEASDYAFKADPAWGKRLAPGRLQIELEKVLEAEVQLESAVQRYLANIEDASAVAEKMEDFLRSQKFRQRTRDQAYYEGVGLLIAQKAAAWAANTTQVSVEYARDLGELAGGSAPTSVGFSFDVGSAIRGVALSTSTVAKSGFRAVNLISSGLAAGLDIARDALESYKDERLNILGEYNTFSALVAELSVARNQEQVLSVELSSELQALQIAIEKYRATLAEGFRLLNEREVFNEVLAASAQRNRYSDMVFRISRNDAVADYRDAFQHVQRYAWLAAKSYDYELGFSEGHPYAATTALEQIQASRHLGQWVSGTPQIGQGGIAEALAQLRSNFETLSGQLGLNQPEQEIGVISMRKELFGVGQELPVEDTYWQQELLECWKDDLWEVPEFVEMCRPFADREDGPQPGLVIEFSSLIENGKNFFGRELRPGDHAYSTSRLGTRIFSAGVIFDNYLESELSSTPRIYLVPVGADVMRTANGNSQQDLRVWNVVEERIPAPFRINQQNLVDPAFNVLTDSLDGAFGDNLRRFPDFRAYASQELIERPSNGDLVGDNRLIGRSISNTRWLLIIPGATFRADPELGLRTFVETISDIKLQFETFSHSGF